MAGGSTASTQVMGDNTWQCPVPQGTRLIPNEWVYANQTEPGKTGSGYVSNFIRDGISQMPGLSSVRVDHRQIKGTGIPGSKIEVTFSDTDLLLETIVGENGNWSVPLPDNFSLVQNQLIRAVQTEPRKVPSNPEETYVLPIGA